MLMLCMIDDFNVSMLLIFISLSVCLGAFKKGDLYPSKTL